MRDEVERDRCMKPADVIRSSLNVAEAVRVSDVSRNTCTRIKYASTGDKNLDKLPHLRINRIGRRTVIKKAKND